MEVQYKITGALIIALTMDTIPGLHSTEFDNLYFDFRLLTDFFRPTTMSDLLRAVETSAGVNRLAGSLRSGAWLPLQGASLGRGDWRLGEKL